jgi:dienelactone hydrolase
MDAPVTGVARWGDVLDVRLTGLAPASTVTIRARSPGYESTATFTAAADGTVDAATTAPSSGTYTGVDPDGLVWSMVAAPDPSDGTADPLALAFRAEVGGTTVATAILPRSAQAADVKRRDLSSSDGLAGAYFAPGGSATRHGAVIVFGGSEGGVHTGESLAAYFASLGHPALGVGYFGAPGLPDSLENIPLEYFQKARDWLTTQPEVDPSQIVVVGASRGGELALLLGATFPWVTGVVAEVPSGVVWPADDQTKEMSSWTIGGRPVPYVPSDPSAQPEQVTLPDGTKAIAAKPLFLADLRTATPAALDAATIRVEKTAGPVLLVAGADDQLWPSCALAGIAMDRLTRSGHAASHDDELVCYPGAGHNVGFGVGFPTASELGSPEGAGVVLALGGAPADIARAQRDVDTRLRAFLAAHLK